jgi:hypothetical protein
VSGSTLNTARDAESAAAPAAALSVTSADIRISPGAAPWRDKKLADAGTMRLFALASSNCRDEPSSALSANTAVISAFDSLSPISARVIENTAITTDSFTKPMVRNFNFWSKATRWVIFLAARSRITIDTCSPPNDEASNRPSVESVTWLITGVVPKAAIGSSAAAITEEMGSAKSERAASRVFMGVNPNSSPRIWVELSCNVVVVLMRH